MNMKTNIKYIIILCTASIFTSCDAVIEEDISAMKVEVLTPDNDQSVNGTDILFWWDYLAGADDYELQIVKPGFDIIEKLAADTIMVSNKFNISLEAGSYTWRIRACNSAYCTDFIYRNLTVTGD